MNDIEKQIRAEARRMLEEGEVDVVIGYAMEDDSPLKAVPAFVRTPDQADRLVWNPLCEANLAAYVPGRTDRIGVVVKGCDARSLVVLMNERQVERASLKIMGVGCRGVVDRMVLEKSAGFEIDSVEFSGDSVIARAHDGREKKVKLADVLCACCDTCVSRNPSVFDVFIGDRVEQAEMTGPCREIEDFEKLSQDERWEYIQNQMKKCIRCYACRNACPLCYCKECQSDHKFPAWIGRSTDLSDTLCFHLMRAIHTAGRCVDCGACSRACPNGVDLRKLVRKVADDVREMYGNDPGMSVDEEAPMASFSEDDPQEFIK